MSRSRTKEDFSSTRASLTSTLTSLSPGVNKLSTDNPLSHYLTQRNRDLDFEINAVKSKLHATSPLISSSNSLIKVKENKLHNTKNKNTFAKKKSSINSSSIFSSSNSPQLKEEADQESLFSKDLINFLARIKLKSEDSTLTNEEIQELFLPSSIMTPGNYYLPLTEVLSVLETDLLLPLTKRDIKLLCDTYGKKSEDEFEINMKNFLDDAGIWNEESIFLDYSPNSSQSASPSGFSKSTLRQSPDTLNTSESFLKKSLNSSPKKSNLVQKNSINEDLFENIDEKIENYIEKYLTKSQDNIKEKIKKIAAVDTNDVVKNEYLTVIKENNKLKKELNEYNESFVNEYGNLKTKYSTLQTLIDDDPGLRKKLYRKLALENQSSKDNLFTKNERYYLSGKKWNENDDIYEDNEEDSRKKLLRNRVFNRLSSSQILDSTSNVELDTFNSDNNISPWSTHHAMTAMQNASDNSSLVNGPFYSKQNHSSSYLPYNFEINETLQDGGLNTIGQGKYTENSSNYSKNHNKNEQILISHIMSHPDSSGLINNLIHQMISLGNENVNLLIKTSIEKNTLSSLDKLKKDNLFIKFEQFCSCINSYLPSISYDELKHVAYGFVSDGSNGIKVNDIVLMLEDMLYNLIGSHNQEDPNYNVSLSNNISSPFTKDSSWPMTSNPSQNIPNSSLNQSIREQRATEKVDFTYLLLKLSKILITLPLISYQPSHLLTRDLHPNYKKFLISSFIKYDKELSGIITFSHFKKILLNEYGIKNFSHVDFLILIKPFALLAQEGKKKLVNIKDIDDDLKNFSLLQKKNVDEEFEMEIENEKIRRKNKYYIQEEEVEENDDNLDNKEKILEKIREKKFEEYLDTEKKFSTSNLNKFLDENNLLTTQELEIEKEKLLIDSGEDFSPSVQIAYIAFIQALCRCLKALKESKILSEMNKKGKKHGEGESITWIGEMNEVQATESLSWTIHAFSLVDFLLNQLETMPLSKRRHTLLTLNYLLEENELKNDEKTSTSGIMPGKVDGFTFLSSLLQVGFHLPRYFRLEILNFAEGNGGKINYLPLLLTFSKTLLDWTNGEKEIVRIILEAMGLTVDARRTWLKKLKFLLINEANKENNIKNNNFNNNINDDVETLKHIQPLVSPSSFLSILRELNVNLTVSQEAALLDGLDGERVAKLQAEMWSEQIKASNPQYIGSEFSANVNNVQKFSLKKRKMNSFLGSGSVTNSSLGGIYSLPMIDFSSFLKFCSRHCGTWMDSSPEFYSHLIETFKKIQLPLLALQEFINSCRSMDAEVSGIISERSFRIAICRSRLFSYLTEEEINILCKFLSEETVNGIDYITFSLQIHSICSNLSQKLVEYSSIPGGVMPPSFSNIKEMLNLENINVNSESNDNTFNINLPTSAANFSSQYKDKSFTLINQLAENGCDWQGQLLPLRNYLVNNTDIQNLFLTYNDLNDMLREFSVIYRREDIDILYLDIGIELNLSELKQKKLIEKKLIKNKKKLNNEYNDYESINDFENELEIDEYCSRLNVYTKNEELSQYSVQNNIVKVFDTQKLLLKLMSSRIHWTRRNPGMTRNLQKKLMMVSEILLEEEANNNEIRSTNNSSLSRKGNRIDLLKEKQTEFLMKLINRIEAFSRVDNLQTISINEWATVAMNRTTIKPINSNIKGLDCINQDPMDINTQIQNSFNDFLDQNNTIYNALRSGNLSSFESDIGGVNTSSLLIPREIFKAICHAMNFQITSEDITYMCDSSDPIPECPRVNPLLLYDLLTVGNEKTTSDKENNKIIEEYQDNDINEENLTEACLFSLNHLKSLVKKSYSTTKRTNKEWKQDVYTLFNGFDKENKNFITFDQFVLGWKLLGVHFSSTDLLKNLHPFVISTSNKLTSPVFYKKILYLLFKNLSFLGNQGQSYKNKSSNNKNFDVDDDDDNNNNDNFDEIINVKDIKLNKKSSLPNDKMNVSIKFNKNLTNNIEKKSNTIKKNSTVFMLLKIIRDLICKKYFILNNYNIQDIWLDLLKIFEKFDPQGINCITEREFCLGLSILLSSSSSNSLNSLGKGEEKFVLTTDEWYEIFKFFEIKDKDEQENSNKIDDNKKFLLNLKLNKKKNEIFINYIKFIELILDSDEIDKRINELKQNNQIANKINSTSISTSTSSIRYNKEKNSIINNILNKDDKKNIENYVKKSLSLPSSSIKYSTNFVKNDEGKSIMKVKQTKLMK